MSKLLRQIVTSGTKKKSGKKKTIRIALDIEYYEKIQLFCERYNRKLNETLKGVIEEFVDEIEKNDPLVHTLIKSKNGSIQPSQDDGEPSREKDTGDTKAVQSKVEPKAEPKVEEKVEKSVENKSKDKEKKPEKSLSSILLKTVKK